MKLKTALLCAYLILIGLSPVFSQTLSVSGKITSKLNNEPLSGATVTVKGTKTATTSDNTGAFSITVPGKGSVLIISYTGMQAEEVVVNQAGMLNFSLTGINGTMNEIVVIGYGQQKKALLTGAISSVKAEQLNTVSNTRIEQALQGRVAGVYIAPSSGQPGAGVSVRIRGTSSNRSTEPLYIIDGIKSGGIESIDPAEIASIDVLKDGASASIYGSEGSNGVIIITTKTGKKNSSEINYAAQFGQQSVKDDYVKMMNAQQYQKYLEEANVAGRPTAADVANIGTGTNWLNSTVQTAPQSHNSLSFSGGSDRSTYYLGGNIFSQEGIVGGSKSRFTRSTVRFNNDYKVKPWLNVGSRMVFSHHQRRAISDNTEFGSILSSALVMDPTTPVFYPAGSTLPVHVQNALTAGKPLLKDENGNYYGISNFLKGEYGNPLARINIAKGENVQNKIFSNVFAEIEPIKGLKFTSRFGIDAAFQTGHGWTPTFWFSDESQNTVANGYDYSDTWFTWLWENFASYSKKIGDHNFTLLAGASSQRSHEVHIGGSYSGLFKEEDKFSYADFVPDASDRIGSVAFDKTLASFYGRLNYDYKGKYLVSGSLRRDGSSLFAEGYKWGTFPAVSAGWVFTSENFFPSTIAKTINYGKLRASWGQNGSLSSVGLGEYNNSIGAGLIYPDGLGNFIVGAAPTSIANPRLSWETGEQADIGADFGLFSNRVSLTVDYYNKKTKSLLTGGVAPLFVGNVIKTVNAGTVENKGFELELGYKGKPSKSGLNWEVNVNFASNKNEVTYLDPNTPFIGGAGIGTGWTATAMQEGDPIWFFYGYKTAGIFQSQADITTYLTKNGIIGYAPAPGDPIVVDVNGDKQITVSDMTRIGSPHPKFIYGGRINLSYKGFDLVAFIQGQTGNDILMGFNRSDRSTANKPEFFFTDRWTGAGSTNKWPKADGGNPFFYNSDLMVFDGAFARIRQLQLGYTLPEMATSKIRFKNVRVYVSLDDYFTFTKYKGVDPEVSNNGNSLGIDRGGYPIPRKAMAGISVNF
ncbi:MAG: TonB-dependent receptor [Ferruginibacter sp.]